MKYMHLQTSYDLSKVSDEALLMALRSLAANVELCEFLGKEVSKVTREKCEAVVAEIDRRRGLS